MHQIPHMASFSGTSTHQPIDCIAIGSAGKRCIVAKVLKGFGVSFTDDISIRVIIKNPDHLPGIPICRCFVFHCGRIIRHTVADCVFISSQDFTVCQPGISVNDRSGINCRLLCRNNCAWVYQIQPRTIVCRNCEGIFYCFHYHDVITLRIRIPS